jgi:hypothetical protein
MSERFFLSQSSASTPKGWEHEYVVTDRDSGLVVGLFLVTQPPGNHVMSFRASMRRAHLRAREYCVTLNRRERERERLAAVPAPHAVALVGGEAGERLELNDLPAAWGGNHLPVPDVHDDVA